MNCRNCHSPLILILALVVFSNAWAEPVATPQESWEQYDLIAKVVVRSFDATQEVEIYDTVEAQTFANPMVVDVVESLRMPEEGTTWTVLAPSYSIYRGKRMDGGHWTNGMYSTTNILALACRYTRDKAGLVVDWVLSEVEWETYRQQKETGAVERPLSQEDSDIQRRLDAVRQRRELRKQMKEGEISREEYKRLSAPFTEILNSPIEGVNY